jgi:acetone carboxylase gamma subunit
MNLYLLTQNANEKYDTYDSCIVVADSEDEARYIHPSAYCKDANWYEFKNYTSWTHPINVGVEFIGVAVPELRKGVVLASFNAG